VSLLDELTAKLEGLDPEKLKELSDEATAAVGERLWYPNEGAQMDAFLSEAFITLYGGRAGGGKTDLGLGLAFTEHRRSLVIRKQYTDLKGLTDRAKAINGTSDGFSGQPPPRLVTKDDRLIMFGSASSDDSIETFQGVDRDLLYIDEAAQIPEKYIRTLIGWTRTNNPDQRCRVVLGSNPPLSDEGQWMTNMFAPWIDPNHPNPAKPGELRWYVTDKYGADAEVPGPGVYEHDDEGMPVPSDLDRNDDAAYEAQSRTFIPAELRDNPYYEKSGYKQVLDNMPEPLRSALRDGNFKGARMDHELQLIPTEWIQEAQNRWKPKPPGNAPMTCIAMDVAQSRDMNVISRRYAEWFDELVAIPGRDAPTGGDQAGLITKYRANMADIVIDLGGGYGNSCYEILKNNTEGVYGHKGAEKSNQRTKQGSLPFSNKRAEVYWRLREALDPGQPGGSHIALPDDPELRGQLASVRLKSDDIAVIELERKVDLVKRIGVSPDKADAVAMAWSRGGKTPSHYHEWQDFKKPGGRPQVIAPERSAKRYRRK
jgi:hypothetical protein